MKVSEIREKTRVELTAQGRDLRMELFNLKLQKATSQLEKPIRLRELRRDIARVETQISQLERKEVLEDLVTAFGQAKEFTKESVKSALSGLVKDGRSRKSVLKLCGAIYNRQRVRLTFEQMAQLIQSKGREKAVELVKAARN
jgi:large subunit ribosomal protein L29